MISIPAIYEKKSRLLFGMKSYPKGLGDFYYDLILGKIDLIHLISVWCEEGECEEEKPRNTNEAH